SPHKIQGWTPDFVPEVLDREVADQLLAIDDTVARDTARRLAAEEGIFCGVSAGATVAAALEVAKSADPGAAILAMLPDTGERYLSTFLLEDLPEGSDDEWLARLPRGRARAGGLRGFAGPPAVPRPRRDPPACWCRLAGPARPRRSCAGCAA